MQNTWLWLLLFGLLSFKPPEFVVDRNANLVPSEGYSGPPFLRTGVWENEPKFTVDSIPAPVEIYRQGFGGNLAPAQLNMCPTAQHQTTGDICLESDRLSTESGNFSSIEGCEKKNNASGGFSNAAGILSQADQWIRGYLELMSTKSPVHDGVKMLYTVMHLVLTMTPALDGLMFLVFVWRTFKSRKNELATKQILEQRASQTGKLQRRTSGLIKNVRVSKRKDRMKRMLSSSQHHNRKLKARVRELKQTVKDTSAERDRLSSSLTEREEQICTSELQQEAFRKTCLEREFALQLKQGQEEEHWRERLKKEMKERRVLEERLNQEILQHRKLKKLLQEVEDQIERKLDQVEQLWRERQEEEMKERRDLEERLNQEILQHRKTKKLLREVEDQIERKLDEVEQLWIERQEEEMKERRDLEERLNQEILQHRKTKKLLREVEDQIERSKMEQEPIKKPNQESKRALQLNLERLEPNCWEKLKEAPEEGRELGKNIQQEVQDLKNKLCQAHQMHLTQMRDFEVCSRELLRRTTAVSQGVGGCNAGERTGEKQ